MYSQIQIRYLNPRIMNAQTKHDLYTTTEMARFDTDKYIITKSVLRNNEEAIARILAAEKLVAQFAAMCGE